MKYLLTSILLAMLLAPLMGCAAQPEPQVRGPGLIFFYTDG